MLKQISIFAENKKGSMNRMTGLLAQAGINISAMVTNDSAEFGIVRMIVSDPEKAAQIMTDNGYLCHTTYVFAVKIGDEEGSLDGLLSVLTESNINIDYIYMSFDRMSAKPIVVFHAPDAEGVSNRLQWKGYEEL